MHIVQHLNQTVECFQVCYNLNSENLERELNGLVEALEYFDLKKGWLVTFNHEDEFVKNNKVIYAISASKWMS